MKAPLYIALRKLKKGEKVDSSIAFFGSRAFVIDYDKKRNPIRIEILDYHEVRVGGKKIRV